MAYIGSIRDIFFITRKKEKKINIFFMKVSAPKDSSPLYYVTKVVDHKPKYKPKEFLVQYDDELDLRWEEACNFVTYDDKYDEPVYTKAFYEYCIKKNIPLTKVTVSKEEFRDCLQKGYH